MEQDTFRQIFSLAFPPPASEGETVSLSPPRCVTFVFAACNLLHFDAAFVGIAIVVVGVGDVNFTVFRRTRSQSIGERERELKQGSLSLSNRHVITGL